MITVEYSLILYSDFDIEITIHITMFSYPHHHSIHTTVTTSYVFLNKQH